MGQLVVTVTVIYLKNLPHLPLYSTPRFLQFICFHSPCLSMSFVRCLNRLKLNSKIYVIGFFNEYNLIYSDPMERCETLREALATWSLGMWVGFTQTYHWNELPRTKVLWFSIKVLKFQKWSCSNNMKYELHIDT